MSGFQFMGFNAISNNISVRLNVHHAYEYTFGKIITIMGIYSHFNIVLLWTMYLGLWCLTPLSTIFQLYRGGQFYQLRKLEHPEKTTDLSQKFHNFLIVRKQTRGHRNLHNIYISYTKKTKVQTLHQLEIQHEKRVNIPCMRTNHRTYGTPK